MVSNMLYTARTKLRLGFAVNHHLLQISNKSNQLKDFKYVLKRFLKKFLLLLWFLFQGLASWLASPGVALCWCPHVASLGSGHGQVFWQITREDFGGAN